MYCLCPVMPPLTFSLDFINPAATVCVVQLRHFVVLATIDADADADLLGHAIAVTDENIVTVHCTVDDEVRDGAAASLQQHTGSVAQADRRRGSVKSTA